jgi:hypothetical protein
MRRFQSRRSVRLRPAAGPWVDAWVAEGFAARLAGLTLLPGLPRGLPRNGVAALESPAGALAALGVRPGVGLYIES